MRSKTRLKNIAFIYVVLKKKKQKKEKPLQKPARRDVQKLKLCIIFHRLILFCEEQFFRSDQIILDSR